MCTLHMHMGRYDHPEVVLILFRSIFKVYAVESQIRKAEQKGQRLPLLHPALNSTNVCCCFTLVSGLDRLFIEPPRLQDDIYPSRSLA
jgi:hypothetical protein